MLRIISISSIFLPSSLLPVTNFDAGVLIPKGKISYHDLVFSLFSDLSKLVSIFIFWQNFVLFNKLFNVFPAIYQLSEPFTVNSASGPPTYYLNMPILFNYISY